MLVIDPETCIDCGVCEPECPAEAIKADTLPEMEKWLEINKDFSKKWPQITHRKAPPDDADKWLNVKNKFTEFYAEKLNENT